MVSAEGTDENGEAGAPDGANTGAEAVVSAAGPVVCAHVQTVDKLNSMISRNDVFKLRVNIVRAND